MSTIEQNQEQFKQQFIRDVLPKLDRTDIERLAANLNNDILFRAEMLRIMIRQEVQ